MAALSKHRASSITGSGTASRRRKAYHTRRNGRNHFLNASFANISGCDICNDEAVFVVKDIKQNILDLQADVTKFFSKYGISCELPTVVGNFKKDVLALYSLLKSKLPEGKWKVEAVQQHGEDGPIKFMVYDYAEFPEYTVWAVPVKKMGEVDDKTRKLLALTFAVMYQNDMYELPEDNYDFQYNLAQSENCYQRDEDGKMKYDEDLTDFWGEDYREMAVRYVEGDISELFNEIKQTADLQYKSGKPLSDMLEDMISQYRAENYHNPHLLDLIENELEICREDWLSEYHISMLKNEFGYDFDNDDSEGDFMDLARLFFFCYDDDDCITQGAIDMINAEAYSLSAGNMYRYSFIDDDDIEERMESSFPQRWADVNDKLIEELRK